MMDELAPSHCSITRRLKVVPTSQTSPGEAGTAAG
jgi:hypothetical protein